MKDIELLKRIAELNKCPECLGSGAFLLGRCEQSGGVMEVDHYKNCEACNGTGAKVSYLNHTKNFLFPYSTAKGISYERCYQHKGSLYPYRVGILPPYPKLGKEDLIPCPTLEEVLEMLPLNLEHHKLTMLKDNLGYCFGYFLFVGADCEEKWIHFEVGISPLTAALKLLEWYLQNCAAW